MNRSIFRSSSIERISSPEQLNDYLRVSSLSVWLVLAAAAILLISFLVWGIFGELPTTLRAEVFIRDEMAVCYIAQEEAGDISAGDRAVINGVEYRVTEVGSIPLSKAEVEEAYESDYVRNALSAADWNIEVRIAVPNAAEGLAEVTITTEYTKPISFLFN